MMILWKKGVLYVVFICMAVSHAATENITNNLKTDLLHDQTTKITCVFKANEKSTVPLTCFFPVNFRDEKLVISVRGLNKSNKTQEPLLVLHCYWVNSYVCTKNEYYTVLHEDNLKTTSLIPIEEAVQYNFSCHVAGRDYTSEQCFLERKDIPLSAEESSPLSIPTIIGIAVGPFVVLSLAVLFCVIRRRLKRWPFKYITCNEERINKIESAARDQSTHNDHAQTALPNSEQLQSDDESQPFIQPESANVSPQQENEDHILWINKKSVYLSSWKKSRIDDGEQEIDQRLKKCLKLQYAINNRMARGNQTCDSEPHLDNTSLSGQVTLQGLLTETKKTLDILKSLQKSIIRKKVNAAIKVSVQTDIDRLQVIDSFIVSAKKQVDDTLSYEDESEGKEIETYVVRLKTITEFEMQLEHHKSCLQKSIRHTTTSRRAEYEKKQLELETLREKFVDMKTMFTNSLNQALSSHALRHSSENTSTQTEQDTHDCLPVTESTIPSPKVDMETKADYEQITTLDQHFPDIDTGNFLIPAKHTKQVHTTSTWIGSKPVDVLEDPTTTQNSTRRHIKDLEDVQEKLHACLSRVMKTTARSDAMIAITQTSFSLYDKQAPGLPDANLDENDLNNMLKLKSTYSDIMIVNKQRGILGGIVQSVHLTHPVKVDQELAESVSRMTKAESVIKEGNKTIPKAEDVAVRMTLILPNITRKQLDGKLAKAVQNVNCLYKDDIDSENGLSSWWDASWLPRQSDTMSNNLYRNLVARFALPAIKVHRSLYKPDHDAQPNEGNIDGDDLQTERPQSTLRPEEGKLLDYDALDDAQDDVKFLYGTEGSAMTKLLHLRTQQWESHFNADTIFKLQTTEDGTDSTDLQTEHGTFKHVDMSKFYSKDPIDATVVLNEEGKETLLTALGPVLSGQSHTAIHIVADKADGDAVAAIYQWLKDQDVKTIRLWAAGKEAPRNNENRRLPVQHIS